MKLFVIGAIGPVGKAIVSQAVAAGHHVTVLVRDAAKASFSPQVKTVIVNLPDRAVSIVRFRVRTESPQVCVGQLRRSIARHQTWIVAPPGKMDTAVTRGERTISRVD